MYRAASSTEQPANTWVKLSPLPDSPVSPRLGYEGACVWDSRHRLLVRYGGHNQGGGGEQGAEVWTFDLAAAKWSLKEPNTSPPGVCCNAQNLYCPTTSGGLKSQTQFLCISGDFAILRDFMRNMLTALTKASLASSALTPSFRCFSLRLRFQTTSRYIRFPLFSGSHGWQWHRELYLNDSSVWTYDLATNRWRNMRPVPTPRLAPYGFSGNGGRITNRLLAIGISKLCGFSLFCTKVVAIC